ncbi:MAG: NAD(P)-dependent glycerol-3-phosphate dehydrogenase [Chloroflexia bacterium]|nr:NAD(P)-dependent glycerol-3-phosphate dehydrogenase [Chloroflexia bacterium]
MSTMVDQNFRSKSSRSVAVVGAGAWGTTLAILAAKAGHSVTLVARSQASADFLDTHRCHPVSLPGVSISTAIRIAHIGGYDLDEAEIVVLAIPTQKLRDSLDDLREILQAKLFLSAAKGLEIGTLLRPSEVIRSLLGPDTPVAALSGPNLSAEIAAGHPAATVIASNIPGLAETLVDLFHSQRFRVYVSDDLIGVELGGALKNIIAIGAGIADGLQAGDNAKAAFMTRGIAEIARLGVACGAQPLTFAGLSGIGDLIATCSSRHSRNHRVGAALANGTSLDDILASMTEVAEGVATTRAARALGKRHGLELPIVEQMHRVLFEGVSPVDAMRRLMEREPAREPLEPDR